MIGEGQPDKIFTLIDHALTACHSHSAGCAENCNLPWPIFVQNRLKQLSITNSLILCEDPLINKPTASDLIRPTEGFVFKSGAAVHNIGQPFEDFSVWALALRLQCLLEQSFGSPHSVRASQLFPPAIGIINRPSAFQPRHESELHIAVSVCREPDVDLSRLFTQTAALLLPSSVSSILSSLQQSEILSMGNFQCGILVPDFFNTFFEFKSVTVIEKRLSPNRFPVATFSPKNNYQLHNKLINELGSVSFDITTF
jgi:hypothetical protein